MCSCFTRTNNCSEEGVKEKEKQRRKERKQTQGGHSFSRRHGCLLGCVICFERSLYRTTLSWDKGEKAWGKEIIHLVYPSFFVMFCGSLCSYWGPEAQWMPGVSHVAETTSRMEWIWGSGLTRSGALALKKKLYIYIYLNV